jgi:hypothetical protein
MISYSLEKANKDRLNKKKEMEQNIVDLITKKCDYIYKSIQTLLDVNRNDRPIEQTIVEIKIFLTNLKRSKYIPKYELYDDAIRQNVLVVEIPIVQLKEKHIILKFKK